MRPERLFALACEDGGSGVPASIRAFEVVLLVHFGVQFWNWPLVGKVPHSLYLALSIREEDTFRIVFEQMLPTAEMERLSSYSLEAGQGPYRLDSLAGRALSNLTWMGEIAIAPLLLVRRTRVAAALAALTLVFAIELAAREIFFGLLYANALLLFLPGRWHVRLVPAFVAAHGWVLLVRLGVAPEVVLR